MPKEVFEIQTFVKGIESSVSSSDIEKDACVYNKNIDCMAKDGKLVGIPGDLSVAVFGLSGVTVKEVARINDRYIVFGDNGDVYRSAPGTFVFTHEGNIGSGEIANIVNNNNELHISIKGSHPMWVGEKFDSSTNQNVFKITRAEILAPGNNNHGVPVFASNYADVVSFEDPSGEGNLTMYGFSLGGQYISKIEGDGATIKNSVPLSFIVKAIAPCVSRPTTETEGPWLWAYSEGDNIVNTPGDLHLLDLFDLEVALESNTGVPSTNRQWAINYEMNHQPGFGAAESSVSIVDIVETGDTDDAVIWFQISHNSTPTDSELLKPYYEDPEVGGGDVMGFLFAQKSATNSVYETGLQGFSKFTNQSLPGRKAQFAGFNTTSTHDGPVFSTAMGASLTLCMVRHSQTADEFILSARFGGPASTSFAAFNATDPLDWTSNSGQEGGWLYQIEVDEVLETLDNGDTSYDPGWASIPGTLCSVTSSDHEVACMLDFNNECYLVNGASFGYDASDSPVPSVNTTQISGSRVFVSRYYDYTSSDYGGKSSSVRTVGFDTSARTFDVGETWDRNYGPGYYRYYDRLIQLPDNALQFKLMTTEKSTSALILHGASSEPAAAQVVNLHAWDEFPNSITNPVFYKFGDYGYLNAPFNLGRGFDSDLADPSNGVIDPVFAFSYAYIGSEYHLYLYLFDQSGDLRLSLGEVDFTVPSGSGNNYVYGFKNSLTMIGKSLSNVTLSVYDVNNGADPPFSAVTNINDPGTVFWRLSFVYDGYQESPLSLAQWDSSVVDWGNNNGADSISISIAMDKEKMDEGRVTALKLYRSEGFRESYRFVKEIKFPTGFADNVDMYTTTVIDKNENLVSYEAQTSMPESLRRTIVNYNISTPLNGHLFIGGCSDPDNEDDFSSYLFKSKWTNYDVFDWTTDVLALPQKPKALSSFKGKLYAFSESEMYRIDPSGFYVEDIYEGIGCLNNHCVVSTDYGMFWCDSNNIYSFNGEAVIPIGLGILTGAQSFNKDYDCYWHNMIKEYYINDTSHVFRAVFIPERLSFVIFGKTLGADNNYKGLALIYNIIKKRWDFADYSSLSSTNISDPLFNSLVTGEDGSIYLANNTSNMYGLAHLYSSADTTRDWDWISKDITLGTGTQDKFIYKAKIDWDIVAPTVKLGLNGDDPTVTTITHNTNDNSFSHKLSDKKNKSLQLSISGASDSEVDNVGIIYRRRSAR